jgi:hypothetical protein
VPGLCRFNPAIDRSSKNSANHAADQATGTAIAAVLAAATMGRVIGFAGATVAGVRR